MTATDLRRPVPFGGYHAKSLPDNDAELTHTGPRTPAGEYFRRFWHPVMLSSGVRDLPVPVRILGENLVLFRDKGGRIGLLDRHCSHRGASLEFGVVTDCGLACCYHGWVYDIDGTVLETPGEPANSRLKDRVFHGAYPTHEEGGLIFAYMGPPAEKPPFPVFDSFVVPGNERVPYYLPFECNWLQVHENGMDPIHGVFLHTRMSGVQFAEIFGALPFLEFTETRIGVMSTAARRWGDHVWVRNIDAVLPNFCQFGATWEDGKCEKYFTPPAIGRWIVPVDDTHCLTVGWRHVNDLVDPAGRTRNEDMGMGKVDFAGQQPEGSYRDRQRNPGDWDAQVSQRPIAVHGVENLGSTDVGIQLVRRQLRRAIRAVQEGERVTPLPAGPDGVIPSFSHDTVLVKALANDLDEMTQLADIGRRVAKIVLESADVPRARRATHIESAIRAGT
jgi:phenylpropionate dioxygenase-like ring-hydroxylating dioxygenase large terminal subunit